MFQKLLTCNYVTLWHPKLSIVCQTSPLYYNKHTHEHTDTHTKTSSIVALYGKAHSLGSLAPVLSDPPFKMAPSWPRTLSCGQAAPEWTEAPWVQAVIHGTRVCKRAASPPRWSPSLGQGGCFCSGGDSKVWQEGWAVLRPRGLGEAKGNGQCFFCEQKVGVKVKKRWMGKPKLMLECVCWIHTAPYPEDNLPAAFFNNLSSKASTKY